MPKTETTTKTTLLDATAACLTDLSWSGPSLIGRRNGRWVTAVTVGRRIELYTGCPDIAVALSATSACIDLIDGAPRDVVNAMVDEPARTALSGLRGASLHLREGAVWISLSRPADIEPALDLIILLSKRVREATGFADEALRLRRIREVADFAARHRKRAPILRRVIPFAAAAAVIVFLATMVSGAFHPIKRPPEIDLPVVTYLGPYVVGPAR